MAVLFPLEGDVLVRVDGQTATLRQVHSARMVGLLAVPDRGALVDVEVRGNNTVPVTIIDLTYGVPPDTRAADVVRARPPEATPSQDGDVTVVTTTTSL
jgi:hypothetical protein